MINISKYFAKIVVIKSKSCPQIGCKSSSQTSSCPSIPNSPHVCPKLLATPSAFSSIMVFLTFGHCWHSLSCCYCMFLIPSPDRIFGLVFVVLDATFICLLIVSFGMMVAAEVHPPRVCVCWCCLKRKIERIVEGAPTKSINNARFSSLT